MTAESINDPDNNKIESTFQIHLSSIPIDFQVQQQKRKS